jgi:hypothetical protein
VQQADLCSAGRTGQQRTPYRGYYYKVLTK